jgi:hypothetical protein
MGIVLIAGAAITVGAVMGGVIRLGPEGVAGTSPGALASVSASATSPSSTVTPTGVPTATVGASAAPSTEPTRGWAPVEIAAVPWVVSMAEHDGRLVAIGSEGNGVGAAMMAYSDDAVTWTSIDTSELGLAGARLTRVAAGDPGFVALGYRNGTVEDLYFFSDDGAEWVPAAPPADCAAGPGPRAVGGGFILFGQTCVVDGMAPPGQARVLTSSDGRSWTHRFAAEPLGGPWATDGERIVTIATCCGDPGAVDVASSDDGGVTWSEIDDVLPVDVTVDDLWWGHGRYVAGATWLRRLGDPDHAVCVSDTGEAWTCQVLSPWRVGPDDVRAVGNVEATPYGFMSLVIVPDFPESGGTVTRMGTSADGLAWDFADVPELDDSQLGGLLSTGHGVFTWGFHVPQPEGSAPQTPLVMVYLGYQQ